MKIEAAAKQLTIFVNGADQWHGRPLYSAIVQLCEQRGIAGATVSRCQEGYGASRQLHTTRLVELSENLPERIEPLLKELEGMIGEGLVAVADVRVLRLLVDPKP